VHTGVKKVTFVRLRAVNLFATNSIALLPDPIVLLRFEQLRFSFSSSLDKQIVKRLAHEIFDLPIKIKGELLDRFVGVLAEVADERLFSYSAWLDVASGALAGAGACRSGAWRRGHSSDN